MVDDNDDATLAAAKRQQLYNSPEYGKIASLLKYDSAKLAELFPLLVSSVGAAAIDGAITPEQEIELKAFISDITLSVFVPAPTVGVHGEDDNHICNNCQATFHENCQLKSWCTVNDVETPCVCLQVDHTAFVG